MSHDDPTGDDPLGWRSSFQAAPAPGGSAAAFEPIDELPPSPEADGAAGPQRYQKIAIIGQGGMGRVWLGWDSAIARHVAIKEPLQGGASPEAARLQREAMLTARLEHPGVVAVHDVFYEQERPLFVMALVRGQTLAASLQGEPSGAPRQRLIRRVLEVCEIIAHAHRQGVVHRDITPRNVLIGEDGTTRVIDWGLAVTLEDAAASPAAAGTPGHMSPEQRAGQALDTRADVWGLGALLYTVLRGRPPGPAPHPPASEASTELEAILARALASAPQARYANAEEMAADLGRWFEGRRVEAFDTNAWRVLARFARVYRGQLMLGALILGALAGALVFGHLNTQREARRAEAARERAEDQARRARWASARAQEQARRAEAASAGLHVQSAREALRTGDISRARHHARQASELAPGPDELGVQMRLALLPEIERLSARTLPPCSKRWILTEEPGLWLCEEGATLAAWRDGQRLWRRDLEPRFTREIDPTLPFDVRVVGGEVHVQSNQHQVVSLDLETGEVLAEDMEHGVWASQLGAARLNYESTRWLHRPERPPCPSRILQAHEIGGELIYVCRGGELWRHRPGQPEPERLYDGESGEINFAIPVGPRRELWVANNHALWPMGDPSRRQDPGEPTRHIAPIGRTPYLLVRGWAGGVRLLDVRRGDWIASFPQGVEAARATVSGELQVLEEGGRLSVWRLPSRDVIRSYRSHHGLADLAWSLDGEYVGAVDGGGFVHMLAPERGEALEPYPYGLLVAKAIAPNGARDFLVTGMDQPGIWRFWVTEGEIKGEEYVEMGPRSYLRRVGRFASGAVTVINAGWTLYALTEIRASEGKEAIKPYNAFPDLDLDPARQRAVVVGPDSLWLLDPEGSRERAAELEGAAYASLSGRGEIAAVTRHELVVFGPDHTERFRRRTDAPLTAVTWRPGHAQVITGHMDGQIIVWDGRDGQMLARTRQHNGRVPAVEVSPGGELLASASWDTTIQLLSFAPLDARRAR